MENLMTEMVASPPAIYHQLQEVMNDPNASFEQYAEIIQGDTGLTARLLKISNSPFYGFESQVESITHAMSIIGLEQIIDLALVTMVIDKFRGIPRDLIEMDQFWRHSIACGIGARLIAKHLKENNTERFYLAGILHDIGSLVIFKEIPVQARLLLSQAREDQQPLWEVEKEVLGFAHSEMGATLLKVWRLPDILIQSIPFVHQPMEAPDAQRLTCALHLADCAAYEMKLGSSGEPNEPPCDEAALEVLSLEMKQYRQIKEETLGQYDYTVDMFLN